MKKISHKIPFRRTLAIICAATIAMLQCAVLLTVEPVHGAGTVDLSLTYKNDGNMTRNISGFNIDEVATTSKQFTVDGKKITLSGPLYVKIFEAAGAKSVTPDDQNKFIVTKAVDEEGNSYDQYIGMSCATNESSIDNVTTVVSSISATTTAPAISFATKKKNPTSALKGDTVTITYSLNVDTFFENSDGYDEDSETKIRWTARNATINGSTSVEKTGKSNVTFKAKITDSDVTQFTPESGSGNDLNLDTTPITVSKKDNIIRKENITIGKMVYNGKVQTPSVTVKLGGTTLTKGTDYTVAYSPKTIKDVGKYTAKITGKGKYAGTATKEFSITQKPTTPTTKSTTKSTTSNKKTLSDYTLKGSIKKGDSKKEVHKKLTLRVDGKTIDSDSWEVTKVEYRNGKAYISFKVKGYEDTYNVEKYYDGSSSNNNNNSSFRTRSNFRINRPSNASSSPSTGTTVPNVTYAPDRTITVKEVYLGEKIEDEPQTDPMDGTMTEPMDGTESTDYSDAMDVETPPLQFGPAAGSAAVAAAAAGAGAVGRIRRFKLDTATEAVEQVTNSEE